DEHLRPEIEDYFEYLRRNHYSLIQFTKGCAIASRRSMCETAFPLPPFGSWMHDTRILAMGHAASSIGYLPDKLIRYRVHGANHSGFIFPWRGYPGKALAFLDALALRRSDSLYRAWPMYTKRPITQQVISEFGCAVGY